MYREARERLGDPVDAWASIVEDPVKAKAYKSRRGKGGFMRASWDEVTELVAAAHVYTTKEYGPDRVIGFSPIPAMSMVSYAAGTRFLSLMGGVSLSFYDWYADLPPASPQVWGDQTDVPESADWWDAGYLMMWGSNIPQTRTPDAHFMTEARYRGQKVIAISPDYAGNTKFADEWLPATAGSDAALAMSMGHVILKEFFVDRQSEYFTEYGKKFTDLPFLVELEDHGDGTCRGGAMLRSDAIGDEGENSDWKTVLIDSKTNAAGTSPTARSGTAGAKRAWASGTSTSKASSRPLSLMDSHDELVQVTMPRFDGGETEGGTTMVRGVPARRIGGKLVTTVYDLALAQYGVKRDGLPGEWPTGYDDASQPHTPAWQVEHTGVDRRCLRARRARVRRERREDQGSLDDRHGRRNQPLVPLRPDLPGDALAGPVLRLPGSQRRRLGPLRRPGKSKADHRLADPRFRARLEPSAAPAGRHPVLVPGQRPVEVRDLWRRGVHLARPAPASSARSTPPTATPRPCASGWTPAAPAFNRNPLDIADEAKAAGKDPVEYTVEELKSGRLKYACEDPDDPANFPRVLNLWRANLIGSSSKGQEYFLKHLLGVPDSGIRSDESAPENRPEDVEWHEDAPEGKLDLFTTIDFRMNGSCIYSDVVLPAATWYEKHDISSTDMHPFVHPFNEAVPPPWEAKTDWKIFNLIAEKFSELAKDHLGTRTDMVSAPLLHDTPEELAQPGGLVKDWRKGECEADPRQDDAEADPDRA